VKKDIVVAAEVRTSRGKNEARRTRAAGKIPAVIYGAFQDPVAVAVSPREILRIVHSSTGYNTIFNLAVEGGETTPVMVVDHQNDPIRNTLLHADFKRIDLTKRIRVTVPMAYLGESKGVKNQGGHFEVVTRSVAIECLPDDIPENFTFDITELMLGESRRANDLPLTGSMKLLSPADELLCHVIAPRGETATAAETDAAAAVVAEPEVVKKGKKEEEAAADDKKKGEKKK
jgi:large subunit ribosomal protein L25